MKKFKIAIIGATGNVGRALVSLLEDREYLVNNLSVFASENSLGKELTFNQKSLKVENLDNIIFSKFEIVFFCTNSFVVQKYYKDAIKNSCIIIDKSSLFRLDKNVPLIIPELNFNLSSDFFSKGAIIANPNCCVIILSLVLFSINAQFPIKRIVISTYQSVSGAGSEAMDELFNQTRAKISFSEVKINKFPFQIAFNLIPFIGDINSQGDTEEELKIKLELQKIISPKIKISVTSVRVPVFISHSMSVNIEFEDHFQNIDLIRRVVSDVQGVNFINDNLQNNIENSDCTPLYAANKDEVIVSRLRIDESQENTVNLWISGDNLRKGAALNSVQILEKISKIL